MVANQINWDIDRGSLIWVEPPRPKARIDLSLYIWSDVLVVTGMNTLISETPVVGQQNLSLMLLANDLLFKALEMHCTDLQLEPDKDLVLVRYLSRGETKKDMQLPHSVHSELAFCYKVLAGLNIKDHDRPQDKHATIDFEGKSIGMRVTAIPGEFGETIAVTFKYPD